MLIYVNLIIVSFPVVLSGLSVLFLLVLLFILLLISRNKSKKLLSKNQHLISEIAQLKNDLEFNNQSLDLNFIEKTKVLQEQLKNQKAIELDSKIALKNAEEANFLMNTFLSNMSLEIRTPLSGIIGFSNMLLDEIKDKEKSELYEIAKNISNSSAHLLELMEHIIELSKIEAKDYELNIKPFAVNTVINSCFQKFRKKADEKNLILEYEQNEIFLANGDKAALEKSIDLILDNAIKYTIEGKITISVQVETDKKRLRIIISDTGIGIDKNFLSDIFKAFRQESFGYSRIQQGAGLGLPLAYKLLHLINGDLQIESERSKGTNVSISLMLIDKKQENDQEGKSAGIQSNILGFSTIIQPFIFIVEDDKMNRMIFDKMLSKYADVQIAIDGEDGFKQLGKALKADHIFDIILLDINLPAPWDGMLLLKEFKKKWPILNKVPFVAQTAYAMPGDREKFLAVGFDDYISKPIDRKELFNIIENNLRKFEALNN